MAIRALSFICIMGWGLAALPALAQEAKAPAPLLRNPPGDYGILKAHGITKEEAEKLGWATPRGIKVLSLREGGPSASAGMLADDIIISIDGQDFEDLGGLYSAISGKKAGAHVQVGLVRSGKQHTVTVTLGPPPPPPPEPFLRIDPGMHTAPINRIGVDAACTLLATASNDKTVRLWRMPKGEFLRTLRPPIAPGMEGKEGKVNAVAVAPDGGWVAAGGQDAAQASWGGDFVYVFQSATGTVAARLGPLSDVVEHLAVSSDGRYLAATLARGNGLRVWERMGADLATWSLVAEDPDYGRADSMGAAFDRAGVLYTVANDGKLRRYARGYQAKPTWVQTRGGKKPHSVAVHPSAKQVAVGHDDTLAVEVYDAATLAWRFSADTRRLRGNGDLWTVAWSTDGARLYAGGTYPELKRSSIVVWKQSGKGSARELAGPWTAITHLLPCGDGIAMGARDPAIGLFAPDGRRQLWQENTLADLNITQFEPVAVSRDGTRLRFNLGRSDFMLASEPVLFDLLAEQLSEAREVPQDLDAPDRESLSAVEENGVIKLLDKQPFEQDPWVNSVAIAPDKERFVLRSGWELWTYDKDGRLLWRREGPGRVWNVNITRDGRRVVAAYDGTIRWHRLDDGEELLTLAVHAKDRRWVAWTPAGYYMASPGAESLIGWHVNRGWDEAAQFYSVDRFREQFNRPDIVKLVLETLDEGKAIEVANKRTNVRRAVEDVRKIAPPIVVIQNPGDASTFRNPEVMIEYNVFSPTGATITKVQPYINNSAIRSADPSTFKSGRVMLTLPPEDTTVTLVAYEGDTASEPVSIRLRWDGATPGQENLRRLRALFVGVNDYTSPKLTKLGYAAKDATDLAAFFTSQQGKSYSKVEAKVLTNAKRADVLKGLAWVEKESEEGDINLLFLAGHGFTVDRTFYYMAADSDLDEARATAVSRDEILHTVRHRKGAMIVMLDTCHSGGSADAMTSAVSQVDMNRAANRAR